MKLRDFGSLLSILTVFGVSGSSAQTVLDTPGMTVTSSGFFRITVDVQAGPSGAPAGFWIDWMTKADYDAHGWQPAYIEWCDFTGTPTLNVDSRSASYALEPNGVISIELGDLFDETGLYATYPDGLPPNTQYAMRIYADGDATHTRSPNSSTIIVSTANAECTQGFWKTHPESWPAGCTPMMLGNVSYTAAQLMNILNTPAQGNGLIFLAHQLISAKLDACNGSDLTNVSSTMASADALIGNLVIPPIGSGYLPPNQCSSYTQTLDNWCNGIISGVVNCPVPVQPATWSAIKNLYR